MELCLRYKTGHERSFYRAWYALRALGKDKIRELLDVGKWKERIDKMAREEVQKSAEKPEPGIAAQLTAIKRFCRHGPVNWRKS